MKFSPQQRPKAKTPSLPRWSAISSVLATKFHYANKPSTVAFEDHGTKLETKTDNENVASAAMVKVALARGLG